MEMDLNLSSQGQFTNYGATSVTIQGAEYSDNIVVSGNTVSQFPVIGIKQLALEDLAEITAQNPDLIIFGTGKSVIYPDFKLLEGLNRLGIGFEVMSIPALCRTYNFLISENRQVVCILFFDAA